MKLAKQQIFFEPFLGLHELLQLGEEKCLMNLLNSPGNFTASKLKWVKDNEPDVYEKIH